MDIQKAQKNLDALMEMLDSRLVDILQCDILPFPHVTVKSLDEFIPDIISRTGIAPGLLGSLTDQVGSFKENYIAGCPPEIPNTVYIDEAQAGNFSNYALNRTLLHEGAHNRLSILGVFNEVEYMTVKKILYMHPTFNVLQEGAAEYLCDRICYQETENPILLLVKSKRKIIASKVQGAPVSDWIEQEVEAYEKKLVKQKDRPYYFGSVFMHVVSTYLSEEEAIRLALNPFKEGVDVNKLRFKDLRVIIAKGDDLFRVTYDEIQNPEKYVKRRLEERAAKENLGT